MAKAIVDFKAVQRPETKDMRAARLLWDRYLVGMSSLLLVCGDAWLRTLTNDSRSATASAKWSYVRLHQAQR